MGSFISSPGGGDPILLTADLAGINDVEFLDFVDTAKFAYYEVIGFGIDPTSNNQRIVFQFTDDGGTSFDTSGYDRNSLSLRNDSASLNASQSSADSGVQTTSGNVGFGSTDKHCFNAQLFQFGEASLRGYVKGTSIEDSGFGQGYTALWGGHEPGLTGVNGFRLNISGGFDAGTVIVKGILK